MWGFNVTAQTYSYDNRPVAPLTNMPFNQWWFHNHLDHPPNDGDFFELPAGKTATTELACNKGATTWFNSSEGGDIRQPNNPNDPCPGSDMSEWHTTGINDLFGCSLAITYQSDVTQVKPEDFAVFSVNQTCVFNRFTDFQVPAAMPPCPPGGCICAWFWIHSPDSGGEQNYMNGFRCNVTGSTSNVALATPQVARRCGADPLNGKMQASPGNCTYGAKQPFYWFQQDQNNMFEGTYSPPRYLDMYNFKDGSQDDIFQNSYPSGISPPSPNTTVVPTAVAFGQAAPAAATPSGSTASLGSSSIPATSSVISSALSAASSVLSSSTGPNSATLSTVTATVIQTATVTQSIPASVTSSSSVAPASTVTNIIFVTVTASDSSAAPTPTFSSTSTVYETVVATVTETASVAPSASVAPVVDSILLANSTVDSDSAAFVQFDALESPSESASSSASPTAAASMCKRDGSSLAGAKRDDLSKRFLYVPGLHSHRKLKKKSSLWNPF